MDKSELNFSDIHRMNHYDKLIRIYEIHMNILSCISTKKTIL